MYFNDFGNSWYSNDEFLRLLNEIQRLVDNGSILTDVIVQAGFTKFRSSNIQVFDFLTLSELRKLQAQADIIITHGGVGSILEGLNMGKLLLLFLD